MAPPANLEDLLNALSVDAGRAKTPAETPDIGIVMGSDSDLDVMMGPGDDEDGRPGAYDALVDELGFAEQSLDEDPPDARFTFETFVVSAHRTPELLYTYADTAEPRGIEVIIAGAGGKSADLPNMTASIAYPLPVIGVPVQEKSVDSVIGMPQGSPMTAVDAGKSFNAALSAVQILSREYEDLQRRLYEYHEDLQTDVTDVSQRLNETGTRAFQRARD